jgi:polysaccharide export outer membrane protein
MVYLQDAQADISGELMHYQDDEYRLQVNDILDVQVISLNPEINSVFNNSTSAPGQVAQVTSQNGGDLFYMTGYSVNENGEVEIPFIGSIAVVGLTLREAHQRVDHEVAKLFSNYHLQIRLGGVRFSLLGEFNKPGKAVILQNQVTIFEALAIGGDLTAVANRGKVRLVRQYPDGTKVHQINLLDRSVIESPFYFIKPNDVIYAEPLKQRSWGIGITGAQTFTTIISTLSTSAALFLSIISLSR